MGGIIPSRMSSCVTLLVIPPRFNICIFIIFLIAQLSLQEEGRYYRWLYWGVHFTVITVNNIFSIFFKVIISRMLLIINFNWVDLCPHYSSPNALRYWNPPGSNCIEEKCVSACEPYWEENGNHCYLWSTDKKNWTEAEDFCQRKGAHLASVTSAAINNYVLKGIDKRGMYSLWIGGSDLEVNGVWKWTDCSVWDNSSFTFWRPGEPNDHLRSQDCLSYHPEDREWDDNRCNGHFGFLCGQRICSGRYSPALR